jgi:hypothetical protein
MTERHFMQSLMVRFLLFFRLDVIKIQMHKVTEEPSVVGEIPLALVLDDYPIP